MVSVLIVPESGKLWRRSSKHNLIDGKSLPIWESEAAGLKQSKGKEVCSPFTELCLFFLLAQSSEGHIHKEVSNLCLKLYLLIERFRL